MTAIDRQQVKQMMDENEATLVEVLNNENYNDYHLPGAINVPLDDEFEETIQNVLPDKNKPLWSIAWTRIAMPRRRLNAK